MPFRTVLAAAILAGAATTAFAQTPTRVAGTVDSYADNVLTVKNSAGDDVAVVLATGTKVVAIENKTLADIKPGQFLGAAAMKGTDGKLHAQIVRIFSESMRGTGEGSRPMSEPNQSMTNATVATVAAVPQGQTLKLSYKGGEKDVQIEPSTKILAFVDADASLLKPGATVIVFASKGTDGKLSAKFVQAEKDGVKPM